MPGTLDSQGASQTSGVWSSCGSLGGVNGIWFAGEARTGVGVSSRGWG